MEHAITVGDLVGWIIVAGGIFVVLGLVVLILAALASQFNH